MATAMAGRVPPAIVDIPLEPSGGLDMNDAQQDFIYARLMTLNTAGFNGHLLASIVSAWVCNGGALPAWLGLLQDSFEKLLSSYFPGCQPLFTIPPKEMLDHNRMPEWPELVTLLQEERAGKEEAELWWAEIVAAACIGMDHLWQDLGLRSRKDLGELLHRNFPALAARNVHDMKWKKFLYKQLCEKEGIYLCRAPSCEQCGDYRNCFGSEE